MRRRTKRKHECLDCEERQPRSAEAWLLVLHEFFEHVRRRFREDCAVGAAAPAQKFEYDTGAVSQDMAILIFRFSAAPEDAGISKSPVWAVLQP